MEGHLDLRNEGYGFLRVNGYLPSRDDAYVPVKLVRQYNLRKGDVIAGPSRPANRNEKNPALMAVETVNGGDPDAATRRPHLPRARRPSRRWPWWLSAPRRAPSRRERGPSRSARRRGPRKMNKRIDE